MLVDRGVAATRLRSHPQGSAPLLPGRDEAETHAEDKVDQLGHGGSSVGLVRLDPVVDYRLEGRVGIPHSVCESGSAPPTDARERGRTVDRIVLGNERVSSSVLLFVLAIPSDPLGCTLPRSSSLLGSGSRLLRARLALASASLLLGRLVLGEVVVFFFGRGEQLVDLLVVFFWLVGFGRVLVVGGALALLGFRRDRCGREAESAGCSAVVSQLSPRHAVPELQGKMSRRARREGGPARQSPPRPRALCFSPALTRQHYGRILRCCCPQARKPQPPRADASSTSSPPLTPSDPSPSPPPLHTPVELLPRRL